MDQGEEKKITIINYNKIYEVEPKMYSLGNIKFYTLLPPIPIYTALVFISTLVIIVILNLIIPIPLPGTIKFLLVPYLVTKKIRVTKKDGKNIGRYLKSHIPYLLTKNKTYERFKPTEKIKLIRFFK